MNINSSGEEACPFCGCAYDEMRTTPGCLMPGALIAGGRYVVGGVMAHDDAQAVYVGFDNTTNRRVSIAEILPERLVYRQEDNEHIAPYSQEAANVIGSAIMLLNDDAQKLGAMRSMDGYAHVIDAVAENGTAYLISEHIDGCSLEDMLLSRGGRISFGEALEMMKPIFSAVDIINGQGITHCAIAPDSIRVTNMGKLKLTGCGEAARFACASESAAGADGKSAYRPREYFNRGEAVNASTDVYGLAATIYRMITGRAPRRQSGGEIAAPSRLGVRMMKNAENALMNALEADKSRRPATARELFLMLSGERESAARAVSSGARRMSTAAIAAIAAAGAALIAVIAMLAAGAFTAKPTHIEYFEEMARQIIREIEIMYSLRGEENIVGYEDHMVLHEPNSLRWEIFIRMELLVPLGTYIRNNAITPEDVRRLGIEICNALEACDSYSIIHRDIKEDNVFLNGRGKFKLGDFGVARETAREGLIMSMRGTRAYIAPEVYGGKNYDKTVDYYSLGILLYKLLNRGRYPFLPPAPERFTADDTETAFLRRINGEKFPPPVDGDEALKDAVMMACEFDPSERFENAAAMRNALMYHGE